MLSLFFWNASALASTHGSAPRQRVDTTNDSQPQSSNNASQEAKVRFRSSAILVQVPVVVVDQNGVPVRSLSKDDFELFEAKKSQKITVFQELGSSHSRFASLPTTPNTFTNELSGIEKPSGVVVFLIDTVNTPFLDQFYGRSELIRYLAGNVDSNQGVALALMDSQGLKMLHDVTQDPAELIQILKKLAGELPALQNVDAVSASPAAMRVGNETLAGNAGLYSDLRNFVIKGDVNIAHLQQDRASEATMRGLLSISWALAGIPGRKSLVWLTGGFPFYIDSDGAVPGGEMSTLYERALKATNDAQISIYPVDVRGLKVTGLDSSQSARHVGSAAIAGRNTRNWTQVTTFDTLREIAEMTGGRAFYNTNDLTSCFQRASADAAHYYLLGYYLDATNRNPGWRKLKVKVKRNDVEVRARAGYFVTNATINPDLTRNLDMKVAINSPFNSTGVPLTVQVNGSSAKADATNAGSPDKRNVDFWVQIAGEGIAVEPGAINRLDMELIAVAFAPNSTEPADSVSQNFTMSIPTDQLPQMRQQGVGYHNKLALSPGQYTVRFVVRDNVSGQVGSVSAPVIVP